MHGINITNSVSFIVSRLRRSSWLLIDAMVLLLIEIARQFFLSRYIFADSMISSSANDWFNLWTCFLLSAYHDFSELLSFIWTIRPCFSCRKELVRANTQWILKAIRDAFFLLLLLVVPLCCLNQGCFSHIIASFDCSMQRPTFQL